MDDLIGQPARHQGGRKGPFGQPGAPARQEKNRGTREAPGRQERTHWTACEAPGRQEGTKLDSVRGTKEAPGRQERTNWTVCEAPGRHQGGRKGPFGQPGRHQGL